MNKSTITLSCALLLACGGGSTTSTEPATSYAGTYQTAVTLTSSTCSGISVQNQPTTVTHAAGASALSLRHAALDYTGTVDADGTFRTTPKPVNAGNTTHTLIITGRFANGGFTADVRVAVTGSGPACEYVVHWVGSR